MNMNLNMNMEKYEYEYEYECATWAILAQSLQSILIHIHIHIITRIRCITLVCFLFLSTFTTLQASRLHPERWYQQQWQAQHGGEIEVVLPDKTRCDWVGEEYALEFDFADKWAEAIGQSLYYASRLNKKAAIVLIIEDEADKRFWVRMNAVVKEYHLPIKTYILRGGEARRSLKSEDG